MNRAIWTAWGLLVVVVDLPLAAGWDIAPDVVGCAWIAYGTWGLTGRPFQVVRVACVLGALAWVVTGTPLFLGAENTALQLTAVTVDIAVWTALVHQLSTAVLALPAVEEGPRNWATWIRLMSAVLGVAMFLGLVVFVWTEIPIYQVMLILSVVVGMLAVVMLNRVARSGALTPGSAAVPPAAA